MFNPGISSVGDRCLWAWITGALTRGFACLCFILIHTIAFSLSVGHALMAAGVCPFMNHLAGIRQFQAVVPLIRS
jgi:hypothetical protein